VGGQTAEIAVSPAAEVKVEEYSKFLFTIQYSEQGLDN
jgi:hypothetical protein